MLVVYVIYIILEFLTNFALVYKKASSIIDDQIMEIWSVILFLLPLFLVSPVFAKDLRVLESQLNNNSITGIIQNPYNYTVGGMTVRVEFYDKEDGHLVGLRDFYEVSKEELKPLEKSSFKIYERAGETTEFPNTYIIVKAEGDDYTNVETISQDQLIEEINNITKALKAIPNEIVTHVTVYENGTEVVTNVTEVRNNNTD